MPRPTRQGTDSTKAQQPSTQRGVSPSSTLSGRIVRSIPVVGDIVKALDKVSGDTTYSGNFTKKP